MKTFNYNIRQTVVLAIIILFSFNAVAQTTLQKAQSLKKTYDYAKAITAYNEYFKTSTHAVSDIKDIIECFMMLNDTKSAEKWCATLVSSEGHLADDVLHYAGILKSNGKYEEAIIQKA